MLKSCLVLSECSGMRKSLPDNQIHTLPVTSQHRQQFASQTENNEKIVNKKLFTSFHVEYSIISATFCTLRDLKYCQVLHIAAAHHCTKTNTLTNNLFPLNKTILN